MTLDEAIVHAENVATRKLREADKCFRHGGSAYIECGESLRACSVDHRQLAEWLKELKAYRETYPYGVEGYPPRDEPNSSEKPNNCETCRHYTLACDLFSEICKYEPKDEPKTQMKTQNSNLTFEKDECAKEYEELGLKELKELIEADRKTEHTEREGE